jgi:hypothetical protein
MESNKETVSQYVDNTEEITPDSAPLKPDERRQYPRRAARWPSTLLTQDKTLISSRTLNVSERGASIAAPCNFAIGTRIIIEIQILYKSLRKSVRIVGEVRHTSIAGTGFTLGILFKEISDPVQDFLKKYAEEKI